MPSKGRSETRTGGRAATTGVILGDYALSVGKPSSPLPDGWHWTQLTDVARLETGHTPSRKHPEYWGGDVPWIGTKDATANHGSTLYRTNQYTNDLGIANSSARVLPANTVCLSRTASVGYVVVMGRPMATSQDFVNWVCSGALDFRYLKYVLLAERESFLRFASGTTHQTIYFPEVKAFHAALPPIREQERIADTLSALDDRIDLLRQTNATLEAIAQALFKSWFVDFDPVRAKAEGREPEGMDAATAALFPSEFEESELGLIPRGWTIARLEEHVEAERGLSYKGAGLADPESGLPMHNLNSVLEGGGYKYAGIKFYTGDFKERHIAQAGDVVVANTEQGHHHRLIGFPAIVPRRFQRGLFSHHLYRVRIRDHSPITRHWIYRALMAPRVRDQIVGCANGSTVNMLKPAGLQIPRFVLPPGALCERFEGLAVALHDRMETNVDLADSLAALRDTLLPRLISGKLRLPKAEESIEEAVA